VHWRTRRRKHQRALEPGTDTCTADGSVRVPVRLPYTVIIIIITSAELLTRTQAFSQDLRRQLQVVLLSCAFTCSSQCVEVIRRVNYVVIFFICPKGQHIFYQNEHNIWNTTQSFTFTNMFRPFISPIIRYSHNNTFRKLYLDAAHNSV